MVTCLRTRGLSWCTLTDSSLWTPGENQQQTVTVFILKRPKTLLGCRFQCMKMTGEHVDALGYSVRKQNQVHMQEVSVHILGISLENKGEISSK